jgi:cyanate lyase
MSKSKKLTVADYLTYQLDLSDKTQNEVAEEVGYSKPNIISMFKQGQAKLPINKVPQMAAALGVDKVHLLRLCLSEYMPETWAVINDLLGKNLVSDYEEKIIEVIRAATGDEDIVLSATETEEVTALFTKIAERHAKDKSAAQTTARNRTVV